MIKTLYPLPGMFLRDPVKRDYLPAAGRAVEMSVYWRRRLRDGCVTETPPAATSSTDSSPPEAAESAASDAASSTDSGDQDAAQTAALSTTEGA